MKKETKEKVLKVVGTVAEMLGTAVLVSVAAYTGGKIAVRELAKDGIDITINKVTEVAEEV
jgi:hypothetical protein